MELQYVFVKLGMFAVWYLRRMLVTILSVRLSLLYKVFCSRQSVSVHLLFIFKTPFVGS